MRQGDEVISFNFRKDRPRQMVAALGQTDFIGFDRGESPKINLVKVEIETKDPNEVYQMGKHCPFVINCMKLSGQNNMMIFLASSSLKKIDAIIDHHFRDRPNILNVQMDIITDFCKNFILPIDFRMDEFNPDSEKGCSNNCPAFKPVSVNKKN